MSKIMYGLYLPLVFPEGLAPGSGSDFNTLLLARDGKGKPVLRGTALAGALRHACGKKWTSFFGSSCGDVQEDGVPSPLKVPDISLEFDPAQSPEDTRTHHMRNRHTNTVLDGALFSLESCPPGTLADAFLWLEGSKRDQAFLAYLASFFLPERGGFLVGGNAARGIGRAVFRQGKMAVFQAFDFTDAGALGKYLDFRQNIPSADAVKDWKPVSFPENGESSDRLTVRVELKIPRGQDLLIADGDMVPQRVRD
ncbi:MAG: RAMP superfamily CRISPR-associated protein, partial [Planctomycetia bacterium]|nr:RAMP superfamily CRISPR-associated protein [Planctomycetia bacterium]